MAWSKVVVGVPFHNLSLMIRTNLKASGNTSAIIYIHLTLLICLPVKTTVRRCSGRRKKFYVFVWCDSLLRNVDEEVDVDFLAGGIPNSIIRRS